MAKHTGITARDLQKFTPKHTHSRGLRQRPDMRTRTAAEATAHPVISTGDEHLCSFMFGCTAIVHKDGARCAKHGGTSRPVSTIKDTLPMPKSEGGTGITRPVRGERRK